VSAAPDVVRHPPAVRLRAELARKAIHLASSAIPLAYAAGTPRRTVLAVLAVLAAVALAVELARFRWARAGALFVRVVGALLREHERRGMSGASWLLAAYVLSVVLFPRAIAVAAMLAAGLGDASAAIVGRTVSAVRARRAARTSRGMIGVIVQGKTLAGSVACAVVTFAAALFVASLSLPACAAAAVAASVAERWSRPVPWVDDNVRVALGAGGAAWLVSTLMRTLTT
jgi:dolichol kinase